jgi:hypothetical protein
MANAIKLLEARSREAFNLQTDLLRFTPPDYVAILAAEPMGLGWKTNVYTGIAEPFWRDPKTGQRWRLIAGLETHGRFTSLSACAALLGAA